VFQVRSLVWRQMTTLVLVLAAAFCSHVAVQACTVFFAFDGRAAIAGQNEDWDDANTQMWAVPRGEGTYGVLYFGFGRGQYPENGIAFSPRVQEVMRGRLDLLPSLVQEDLYGIPQQGVNEKGLFFGGAQTDVVTAPTRSGRPIYDGAIVDLILRKCATAAEARKLIDAYQYTLPAGQLLFADRSGDSFILEAGHVVVERTGRHQVMTNLLQSREPGKKLTDDRYVLVDRGLRGQPLFSEGLAVSLLSAAQQPITQYSLVFNLTEGRVSVFRDRRFEDRIELQVQSEIAGAPRASTIRRLFLGAGR
jgi:hypothetical protein